MRFNILAAALCGAAALAFAAPATATPVQVRILGKVSSGTDSGTDLSVDFINNHLVESFPAGTIFGVGGNLLNKAIEFRFTYDPDTAPVGDNGVFEDLAFGWPFGLNPTVIIGGVARDLNATPPGQFFFVPAAKLTLTDGATDGFAGEFSDFSAGGGTISDYFTNSLSFAAVLPAGFFSTIATLPSHTGGLASAPATGGGVFSLTRQTCFISCSSKTASGAFTLSSVSFVPEPGAWALLIAGFGLTGATQRISRRRRGVRVVAA